MDRKARNGKRSKDKCNANGQTEGRRECEDGIHCADGAPYEQSFKTLVMEGYYVLVPIGKKWIDDQGWLYMSMKDISGGWLQPYWNEKPFPRFLMLRQKFSEIYVSGGENQPQPVKVPSGSSESDRRQTPSFNQKSKHIFTENKAKYVKYL